ncbi:MAG TPA: T9SS type A sorting domain-containing protein [Bacteroidales bacterium]|nr:T9SS type A sorting domain-containing protein [Bacteroidales bacterium]
MTTFVKYLIILLCNILINNAAIYGQLQVFEKTYGTEGKAEFAYEVIETPDNGYIMIGISMNNPNPTNSLDGKIKRVDINGNLIWEQTYTGMNGTNDFFSSIIPKGINYLVAGSRFIYSPLPPWYLKKQFWLIEIDETGSLIQQKNFGGNDDEAAEKIICTEDGGYLMLGFTKTFGTQLGGQDVWLLKLNNELDSVWSVTYDFGGEDNGVDILPINDKYIILVNSCVEDCNTVAGNLGFYKSDSYYLLIDNMGNLEATYSISPGLKNNLKTIKSTIDGGAVIIGATDAVAQNYCPDLWVIKLDENLDTIWTKIYGNPNAYDGGRGIFQQDDGNYFVGGYSQSFVIPEVRDFDCPWVMKLDYNGDSIWSFISGTVNNDGIMNIIQTSDGSIVATGYYELDSKPESLFDLDLGPGKFYLLKLTDITDISSLELNNRFVLYPNPVNEIVYIKTDEDKFELELVDILGQILKSEKDIKTIYIGDLAPGTYIIRIKWNNNLVQKKVLVY